MRSWFRSRSARPAGDAAQTAASAEAPTETKTEAAPAAIPVVGTLPLPGEGRNVWRSDDLDAFVARCDAHGGVQSPAAVELITHFEVTLKTSISADLDPMSAAYQAAQIAVYEEISGRTLNQMVGEQAHVPDNAACANPYGSRDVASIAKAQRAISNALMLADLPPNGWVLDMGCGWGLSTEVIAFTSANVHAVDINPDFIDLVRRRTAARGMAVVTEHGAFDTFASDRLYDMIFFYECLHHSVSVGRTLAHVAQFASPRGSIILCGEPVTSAWWGSWGMRLDPLSVYCMRKFGWFETGWSETHLKAVFAGMGWKLWLIAGIGLDHGYIGLAMREETPDAVMMDRVARVIPTNWATIV